LGGEFAKKIERLSAHSLDAKSPREERETTKIFIVQWMKTISSRRGEALPPTNTRTLILGALGGEKLRLANRRK